MQPSPYDRTVAVLRVRFRRQPVAFSALLVSCVWIALTVYENAAIWNQSRGNGWFLAVTDTVAECATGVLALAALVWLIDRVFGDQ
jgi:hypothetical protein